jgi:hypothetical protein
VNEYNPLVLAALLGAWFIVFLLAIKMAARWSK